MRPAPILFTLFAVHLAACGSPEGDDGGDDGSPICEDTCQYANDGECDDGGPGADFDECAYGSDCADCGPRDPISSTCTCDATAGCDPGCLCDPDCGQRPIGSPCACGPDVAYCSDTSCATSYCLWQGGIEGYCSQSCGTCPAGFECADIVGVGTWCMKLPTVPPCGTCTDSSDCQPFPQNGFSVEAACFNGRCRMRCTPGSGACSCVAGTPAGGNATGYCADDGC
jgi:hypothetical protein